MRTWITSSPIARPIFIIVGDFNAKLGSGEPSKSCTAAFGLGTGNSRGDSVINFAERQQLKVMNTFFKKSPGRRWIWISPKLDTWIRQETGVRDIINAIRKEKHRWAGNIARLSDNPWTIRATEWIPRDWTRKQGRPRWRDDLTRQFGPLWSRLAKHRHLWDQSREGFLCQD